jgi:two-component system, NarL family, response regulator NreC
MPPIRILIADDHGVLRAGLTALLSAEPQMEVGAEASDGKDALKKTELLKPDVVLLDLSMGELGGIDVAHRLRRAQPDVKVLILTVHEDKELLREAMRAGASGYVLKKASKNELVSAIHSAMRGDFYIHPSMTRALISISNPGGTDQQITEPALTPKELEVLKLIARGFTNAQVGKQLNTSVRTVEYHRSNIMSKLALETRDQIVKYAIDHQLI